MTKVMSVIQVRANIYNVMDEIVQTHEPVLITGKRNNVVMLSQEDWNAIKETLYLDSEFLECGHIKFIEFKEYFVCYVKYLQNNIQKVLLLVSKALITHFIFKHTIVNCIIYSKISHIDIFFIKYKKITLILYMCYY